MQNVFHQFLSTLDPAPVRTWSLILTFYGDCIMPRGGELWLTNLSHILRALGVKPNSARTAMSRLERDGFLERRRLGRTSHYALSERALALSREAEMLIYRNSAPVSPPGWDIAAFPDGGAARKALKREGYEVLLPGLFMRPAQPGASAPDGAIAMTAQGNDAEIARALYPLESLAARYRAFVEAVPLIEENTGGASPLDAVILRLALVHGFRRIVLRDPHLSPAALPDDWPADAAYRAFAQAYRSLAPASEQWLDQHARNSDGKLAPSPHCTQRFLINASS